VSIFSGIRQGDEGGKRQRWPLLFHSSIFLHAKRVSSDDRKLLPSNGKKGKEEKLRDSIISSPSSHRGAKERKEGSESFASPMQHTLNNGETPPGGVPLRVNGSSTFLPRGSRGRRRPYLHAGEDKKTPKNQVNPSDRACFLSRPSRTWKKGSLPLLTFIDERVRKENQGPAGRELNVSKKRKTGDARRQEAT